MATDHSVSVIVTVFNRQIYVSDCLGSILDSEFGGFEIVAVDDASSDSSVAIIDEFTSRDSRIRLYQNKTNLGDYPNRRRAIELSSGELIKFLDADDLIYPHSLGLMVEAMERYPEAALALSHSAPELELPYPILLPPKEAYRRQFLGRGCLSCGPSGAIFRRSAYEEIGGFRDWGVLNDIDLWQRMAARWPVVLLPPALVWWRRHEGQEFTRGDAGRVYLEKGFELGREALQADECPLNDEEREKAMRRLRQHHARRLLSLGLRERRPREAWELFRRSGLGVGELMGGFKGYG